MLEWIGKRYMRMQRVRHEEQGFTLIELLIVVYGSFTILLTASYVEGVVALS